MRVFFKMSGLVQGIGYRWFVRDTAEKYGLAGFVRNRYDGSVEGEAQGQKKALDAFIKELKTAHPWAKVTNADIKEIEEIQGTGFIIESSN